jgi:hypothetical protein
MCPNPPLDRHGAGDRGDLGEDDNAANAETPAQATGPNPAVSRRQPGLRLVRARRKTVGAAQRRPRGRADKLGKTEAIQ